MGQQRDMGTGLVGCLSGGGRVAFCLGLLTEPGRPGARESVSSVWEKPCLSGLLCSLWPLSPVEFLSLGMDPTGQVSAVANRRYWVGRDQQGASVCVHVHARVGGLTRCQCVYSPNLC